MKLLTTILSLFITVNSFASSILDSAYNSVDFSYGSSFGDVVASGTEVGVTFKPQNVDLVLSYSHADVDFDEVLGYDISSVKGDGDGFGLGYVMVFDDNSHIIPFISTGSLEYSYGDSYADLDFTTFGVIIRSLYGENSVFNFSFQHVNYDDLSISSTARSELNTILTNPLSDPEYDSIEEDFSGDATILGVSLEYHFEENVSLSYGLSTDFDSVILSLNLGWNY